tara:strand:+ start:470 stop:1162 length:693 start_codon:yes stop_codon:yes gene_type:complete
MKLSMPKMPKMPKMPSMSNMPKMDKLLNDKNVLYVVFVIAILNVVGYLMVQNTEAVAFFLVIGFLSTYFSKNMTIVLLVAIVSTSIFVSSKSRFVKEGMSTQKKDDGEKEGKVKKEKTLAASKKPVDDHSEDEPEGLTSDMTPGKKPNKLDYAGTLEKAYENLQNHVGEGGIEGLTGQTKTLLEQQKNLMDNIKGMEPFLNTAQSFMNNMDLSKLEGLGGMLSKFTGTKE